MGPWDWVVARFALLLESGAFLDATFGLIEFSQIGLLKPQKFGECSRRSGLPNPRLWIELLHSGSPLRSSPGAKVSKSEVER